MVEVMRTINSGNGTIEHRLLSSYTPTTKEQRWINRLVAVLKDQPSTVWLFVGDSVNILRKTAEGKHAMTGETLGGVFYPGRGYVDQDYLLFGIACDCDGGDW